MSVGCNRILARMGAPAATRLTATSVCVLMVGVDSTALKTLMTVLQLHATEAPPASIVLHLLSVYVLMARQVG